MYVKIERKNKDNVTTVVTIRQCLEVNVDYENENIKAEDDETGEPIESMTLEIQGDGSFDIFPFSKEDRAHIYVMNEAGKTIDTLHWLP